MFTRADGLEADKGNVHCTKLSDRIKRSVSGVMSKVKTPYKDEDENMKRNNVDNINISAPSRGHVPVAKGRGNPPEDSASADCTKPAIEGDLKGENGDALVVETAGDGALRVTGDDGHENGC